MAVWVSIEYPCGRMNGSVRTQSTTVEIGPNASRFTLARSLETDRLRPRVLSSDTTAAPEPTRK